MSTSGLSLATLTVLFGGILAASNQNDEQSPAEADEYQRRLKVVARDFYEGRVAAHQQYLSRLRDAKRTRMEAGSVSAAGRLERREEVIEARLETDRAKLRRSRHALMPAAQFDVEGSGFQVKTLRDGATAYANRDYKWQNVPSKLDGWRYTQIDGGDTPEFHLVVRTDGVLYALAEGHELEACGWTSHPKLRFQWYPGRSPMGVFTKEGAAGEVVEIPHHGWTGTMVLMPRHIDDSDGKD